METLLIRFAATPATAPLPTSAPSSEPPVESAVPAQEVQWLLADHAGGRLAAVMQGSLSEAAALAQGRRVIVLVPGCEAVLAELDLPAKNAARLQQMVPFALEEQLASDLDEMHFALGKRGPNGKTPVATVAHALMQRWLDELRAVGIAPSALYPESLLLPATTGGATLVVERDMLYVRGASICGTSLDAQPFAEILNLALPADKDTPVTAYVAQSEYERLGPTLETARERLPSLQIKLLPNGPLPLFAVQACADDNVVFDLMQGKYERPSSFKTSVAPWRLAAALLFAAVGLNMAYNGTQLWRLARAEKQIDRELGELIKQTLPDVNGSDAGAARRLFESRLNALKNNTGAGGLLSSLSALGSALAQTPDTHVEALAYRNKTMDLQLKAPNVDALDKLRTLAQSSGLQAELQSATPREKVVEGRLRIKSPDA